MHSDAGGECISPNIQVVKLLESRLGEVNVRNPGCAPGTAIHHSHDYRLRLCLDFRQLTSPKLQEGTTGRLVEPLQVWISARSTTDLEQRACTLSVTVRLWSAMLSPSWNRRRACSNHALVRRCPAAVGQTRGCRPLQIRSGRRHLLQVLLTIQQIDSGIPSNDALKAIQLAFTAERSHSCVLPAGSPRFKMFDMQLVIKV